MSTPEGSQGMRSAEDWYCEVVSNAKESWPASIRRIQQEAFRAGLAVNVAGMGRKLTELAEAAKAAQCDCSPKERDSGHKAECWFPALQAALAKPE